MRSTSLVAAALATQLLSSPVDAAQSAASPARPTASAPGEAADVAAAWALLAQGPAARAAQKAQQVLAAHPRSAGALAVAVAAAGAQGAAAGLSVYDQWIGARTIEEPLVLRSIALLLLREEARQTEDPIARGEANRALAQAGESPEARNEAALSGTLAELKTVASSAQAANLIGELGASGAPQALPAILARADDPRTEIRAAVADALGHYRDTQARAQLKQMLSDRTVFVRARAAGALLRLDDNSGVTMLQQLSGDDTPSVRLAAATALAASPDANWIASVRQLTESPDPEIRASSAVLLAPHDPARAREILEALQGNANPAIRDLAQASASEIAAASTNLTQLRAAFRASLHTLRTRAAARVVDLTR